MESFRFLTRIIHERFYCFGPLQQKSNGHPDLPLRQVGMRLSGMPAGGLSLFQSLITDHQSHSF